MMAKKITRAKQTAHGRMGYPDRTMTDFKWTQKKAFILARQTVRRRMLDDPDFLRAYKDNVSMVLQDRLVSSKRAGDDIALEILDLVLGLKEEDFKFCVHCTGFPQDECPNLVEVAPGRACEVAP